MKNILVVSGHTNLNNSVVNKKILNELQRLLPNANFDLLDKLYPDYKIDVISEQKKLVNADIIVLQFPVFWYGIPSLLQKWLEDVFTYGFSHGDGGNKLNGKKVIISYTTGAKEEVYQKDGLVGYEINEFLISLKATCNMCGMNMIGDVYTGGVSYQMRIDKEKEMLKKAKAHANKVYEIIMKEKIYE